MSTTRIPERERFVPERAQEAGGSLYAGPLQRRTRRLPARLDKILRSRVVALATTPHGPEHYLTLFNPLWSLETTRAVVTEVRRETRDVSTLVLDPGPDWPTNVAGQHVNIRVEVDGRRRQRTFTVASAPRRGRLELTIKGHPDGYVSRFLALHSRPGLVIEVSDPAGEFVLPSPLPAALLFVAGGSGITPLASMLRQLVADGERVPVTFVHYVETAQDRIFAAELDELEARHPWLTVVTVVADGADVGDHGLRGHLDRTHLDTLAPDWAQHPTYLCGPPGMLDAADEVWQDAGVHDQLHIERFTLDVPSSDTDAEGTVTLARSDLELDNDGRPLLVQAEDAGLEPEYGCRMGICKTCTVVKKRGVTQNLTSGEVSRDTDEDVQICVSVALGDVTLDL